MLGMKITGTGSYLPERVVTNVDMEKLVETSDEWIRERTGIRERRMSSGETVAQLAAGACERALQMAGKEAVDVDLILVATCSPELLLPCCACQVQGIIGAVNATAFDLNAACSGFLFALQTAQTYLQCGIYKNALVVGSEVLSKLVDFTDRSTCVLFGDGAGAVFVESCEDSSSTMLSMVQGSDGSLGDALTCATRGEGTKGDGSPMNICPLVPGTEGTDVAGGTVPYIRMNGKEVYKFATRKVPMVIEMAVEKAGLTVEDVDLFVLHQANVRIIETAAKHLKADLEKFPMNLERVGNMSSATIPVLLDELNRSGRLKRGHKIAMAGFGAGLTYGASVIVW